MTCKLEFGSWRLLNNSHRFIAFSSNEPKHNIREFPSLHLFNFNFLINSSTRLLAWLPLFILYLSSLFLFVCSLLEARSVTVINIITPTSLLFIFSSKLPQREKKYIKSLSHRIRWKQDAGNALKYDILLACLLFSVFIYLLIIYSQNLCFCLFDVKQRFWPSIVMNKWLNIKPKVYDFSEDEVDTENESEDDGKYDLFSRIVLSFKFGQTLSIVFIFINMILWVPLTVCSVKNVSNACCVADEDSHGGRQADHGKKISGRFSFSVKINDIFK